MQQRESYVSQIFHLTFVIDFVDSIWLGLFQVATALDLSTRNCISEFCQVYAVLFGWIL